MSRRRGRLYRTYTRLFGTTRPAMWFARHVEWKVDPLLLRLTRGRLSLAVGIPTVLLETRGARSGQPRRHGVIWFDDAGTTTIVASKFGEPTHPAWFHNLRAHPDVLVNGRRHRAVIVEDGAELARLWPLADAAFPPFAVYREWAARTGRQIPIVRLEPVAEPA